ncbi:MAG: hypothetical protein ABSE68_00025 [Minisyncoccia bacterium]
MSNFPDVNSSEEEIVTFCQQEAGGNPGVGVGHEMRLNYGLNLLAHKQQQKLLANQDNSNRNLIFWTKILALTTIGLAMVTAILAGITYQSSQRQITLELLPSVEANYDAGSAVINVINRGRGNLYIWGDKFGNGSPVIDNFGVLFGPGSTFHIPVDNLEMTAAIKSSMRDATSTFINFEIYFKNQDETKFVSRNALSIFEHNGTTEIDSQTRSIDQVDW